MSQVEALARQTYQLRDQGVGIDHIADVMGKLTSDIEHWIGLWLEIAQPMPPWYEELNINTMHCLEKIGITSHQALLEAGLGREG